MDQPTETQNDAVGYCPIVALIGRPNVGKSTLFNRITKSRLAIVDPTPGVTRDRHYERVCWNDRCFILVDTGGIEDGTDESMATSIREQALAAIQEADIILLLLDGREGLSAADIEIAAMLRRTSTPVHFVINKVDGPDLEETLLSPFFELGAPTLWPVSAEHGYGVRTLLDSVVSELKPNYGDLRLPADTIRLAVLGRPNVGKSSLINRVLEEDRMVVSNIPGTTRDSVDSLLTRRDKNYLMIDTAGIRRKGKVTEKLEKFSIIHALAALERCDIVLLLIDADEGITEQDTKVIGYVQDSGRACILLVNKWDLVAGDKKRQKQLLEEVAMATTFVGFAPVLTVSALTGTGIARVFPIVGSVYRQYTQTATTSRVNKVLGQAVDNHPPSLYRGRRLKFFYATQLRSRPPTFAIVTNYPKGVHFSYHRFLVNQFREGLGLERSPVRILLRERKRREFIKGR